MRDLQVVREKRDYLRGVYDKASKKRAEVIGGRPMKEMSQYEIKQMLEIWDGMNIINAQIEALTFVLNEDSEISEAYKRIQRGLTYDDLFEEDIYEAVKEEQKGGMY
ncbi:hypothetical protein [Bacillus phage vB_BanS-Thrax5]|nr:hypothetical protein [Bacillus phage vB_BanS-Thrax5]